MQKTQYFASVCHNILFTQMFKHTGHTAVFKILLHSHQTSAGGIVTQSHQIPTLFSSLCLPPETGPSVCL